MQGTTKDIFDETGLSYNEACKGLLRLPALLDAETKLENLFDLIGREAGRLLKAGCAYLFLLNDERKELYSQFPRGLENREISLPLGRGTAGTVAFTGQSLCLNDIQNDTSHFDDHFGYFARNVLAAPLRTHYGRVIGVLQVINKLDGDFNAQ